MACIRYICTCIFIIAAIVALMIPFSEGRKMKALKKEKFNSFADETGLSNHAKKTTEEKNIPAGHEGKFQVAPPTPSDDFVSGGEVTSSPTSTNKNPEFGTMLSSSTTDFKPTAPGNSPGVGHKVLVSEQDNQQMPPPSSHSAHTLESSPDDFKPTTPGRSPGVGHSFHTMKNEPNA